MISPPPMSIANTMEAWVPGFWQRFYSAVWAGYYRYGGSMQITSWYRSPEDNRRVGGHRDSQHLVGMALDLVPSDQALARAMQMAGFQAVLESTHVHVQAFPAGVLREAGFLDAVGV